MSQTLSPSLARCYGLARVARVWKLSRASVYRSLECQIAFNCDPPFASNNDPASVHNGRAESGGAEPRIAEQSRSRRAASGEREVMRGS
jgi:hypothetical protein